VDNSLQAFKALAACNPHLQISVKLKEDCLDQSHNSHKQLDLELKEHLGNNNQHKICLELRTHSKQSLAKILVSNLEISLMLSKSRRSLKLKTNPLSLNQHLDQQLKASVFNLVSRHHKLLIALHSVVDLELQHQTSLDPLQVLEAYLDPLQPRKLVSTQFLHCPLNLNLRNRRQLSL
jgi:hypothetical protein